jgi:hypothetical protein
VGYRYGERESDKTYLPSFPPNTRQGAAVKGLPIFADPDESVETETTSRFQKIDRAERGIAENENSKSFTERVRETS